MGQYRKPTPDGPKATVHLTTCSTTVSGQREFETLNQQATRLRSKQQCCKHVGAFYEEAIRVMVNGERHLTQTCADICPDVSGPQKRFFVEVKAGGGRSAQFWLWDHQLDRYEEFIREYVNTETGHEPFLYYALWHYHADRKLVTYSHVGDLFAMLSRSTKSLFLIPAVLIRPCIEEFAREWTDLQAPPHKDLVHLLQHTKALQFIRSEWMRGQVRRVQWQQIDPLLVYSHQLFGFTAHALIAPEASFILEQRHSR